MSEEFQNVVKALLSSAIEIDTINAEQFDATISTNISGMLMVQLVNLQTYGYSISVARKGRYFRIMIEKN